ncbi:MAG: hypothetical protein ABJA50_13180, partial [Chloroflexota bacterium]
MLYLLLRISDCRRTKKMAKKLYVGNLPYGVDEQQLRDLFSQAGEISDVAV